MTNHYLNRREMKITFEIQESELNNIVVEEIKKETRKYFENKKDSFVKETVERETKELRNDGFFKRQISTTLNKAVFDKVNREFKILIEERISVEIEKVFKDQDLKSKFNKLVDQKVNEKLKQALNLK